MAKSYWNEDRFVNAVIKGDCTNVMQHLPDGCIDMVLCDLPYGTTQNKWDSIVPLDKLWAEYRRIVKPNGAIVLTSQGLFTAALIMSQPKLFKYKWVWEKSKPTNFLNDKKQPLRKHEDVCVFYNKQPVYNPQMIEGEPYDKGVRKNQLSGSYGDFHPVHVYSDGKRYPTVFQSLCTSAFQPSDGRWLGVFVTSLDFFISLQSKRKEDGRRNHDTDGSISQEVHSSEQEGHLLKCGASPRC